MGETASMLLWSLGALVAALYCLVKGVEDIRQRRFVWGALGIAGGAVILLMPTQTHAVKIELPLVEAR